MPRSFRTLSERPGFAAGFFLVLTLLFFGPCLVTNRYFYPADFLFCTPPWYRSSSPDQAPLISNYDLFDVIIAFYPHDLQLNESLHNGILPLWNPLNLCGHPLLANGWSGLLYPPRLLAHLLLPTAMAHQALLFVHLFLAGWGMWWLARRLGQSGVAASLAGVAWMFNGVSMSWWEFEHAPICSGLLPWLILALDQARTRWSGVPLGAAMCGLLVVMGVLQLVAYALIIAGLMLLWRLWSGLQRGLGTLRVALALACGLLLAAPNLLAVHDLLAQSERPFTLLGQLIGMFRSFLITFPPTLVAPDAYGTPIQHFAATRISGPGVGTFIYPELCAYSGVLAVLLATCAVRLRGCPRFLLGVALLTLLVPATPLYWVPYHLPGFNHINSTRVIYVWVFCIALLAGFGWDALSPRWLAGAALALALLWTGVVVVIQANARDLVQGMLNHGLVRIPDRELFPSNAAFASASLESFQQLYAWSSPAVWLPLTWLILTALVPLLRRWPSLVVAVLAADLMTFGMRFNPTAPAEWLFPPTPVTAYLTNTTAPTDRVLGLGTFKPDTMMPFKLEDLAGYEAIYPQRAEEYVGYQMLGPAIQDTGHAQLFPIKNGTGPLVDLAGVRYCVTYPGQPVAGMNLVAQVPPTELAQVPLDIYENPHRLPRAFVAPCHEVPPPEPPAGEKPAGLTGWRYTLARLGEIDLRQTVILESQPSEPDGTQPGLARITRYELHEVQVQATAPTPGWLVLTDTWTADWKAWDNDRPVPVQPADLLFRAVHLSAGDHKVVFRYQPDSWSLGWAITGMTALGLGLLGAWSWRGKR